jgi:hypothetical protein
MPLIGISIKLAKVDETLLYKDAAGNLWLSAVCVFDCDDKGRTIISQSIPKERFAAGEKGPAIGTWREIGNSKPAAQGGDGGLGILRAAQAAAQTRYAEGQEQFSPEQE